MMPYYAPSAVAVASMGAVVSVMLNRTERKGVDYRALFGTTRVVYRILRGNYAQQQQQQRIRHL
jgi:hypothetical protein